MPNATPQDAQLILQIYDLRREAEMRKARNYVGMEWWPNSMADVEKTVMVPGSDANRWFRQVLSFWEMAATLVLHGAVHEELFLDTAQEMFFVYAKLKPFIPAMREKYSQPDFLAVMETLIQRTPKAQEKAKAFDQRVARVGKMMAEHKAKAAAGMMVKENTGRKFRDK